MNAAPVSILIVIRMGKEAERKAEGLSPFQWGRTRANKLRQVPHFAYVNNRLEAAEYLIEQGT